VAIDIAASHRLVCTVPHVFSTGTNLVVGLDNRLILKIFPPMLRAQFVSERGSLSQLRGRLRVPIPEIVHEGARWVALSDHHAPARRGGRGRLGLAATGGQGARARRDRRNHCGVQRVPPGRLLAIEPRWDGFMRGQIEGCRARHQRLGLAKKFLDGLDDLLRDARELIPMDAPPVILTGEYIPENFLLECQAGRWRVAGLIDFGDVLTGWRDYDLLGPSAFMAAGQPRLVRSLFEGFGYSRADIDFALKRRLMALLLLHRASDPNRHICIGGWQQKADNLVALQELIWLD
jgi:hygromycin-B 7''-O-kinase